jgi:hypothetical protein
LGSFHWFLAIIYLPAYTLLAERPPPVTAPKITRQKAQELGGSDALLEIEDNATEQTSVKEVRAMSPDVDMQDSESVTPLGFSGSPEAEMTDVAPPTRPSTPEGDMIVRVPSSDTREEEEVSNQLNNFDAAMSIGAPVGDTSMDTKEEGEMVAETPPLESSPLTEVPESDMELDHSSPIENGDMQIDHKPSSKGHPRPSIFHHASSSISMDMDFISMPLGEAKPGADESRTAPKQTGIPPEQFYGKQAASRPQKTYKRSPKAKDKQKVIDLDDDLSDLPSSQQSAEIPVDFEQSVTLVFSISAWLNGETGRISSRLTRLETNIRKSLRFSGSTCCGKLRTKFLIRSNLEAPGRPLGSMLEYVTLISCPYVEMFNEIATGPYTAKLL